MRRGRPSRTSNCVRRRSSRSTCRCTRPRGSRRRSSIVRVRSTHPRGCVRTGLYAPLNADWLRERGITDVLGPEAERSLVDLASRIESRAPSPKPEPRIPSPEPSAQSLPRLHFIQPDRAGLPALKEYASLRMPDGTRRIMGSTDATRGCKHLCRHCPIVPVYQRTVPRRAARCRAGGHPFAGGSRCAAHLVWRPGFSEWARPRTSDCRAREPRVSRTLVRRHDQDRASAAARGAHSAVA